jgi:lipopolysaccharide export system permease protein
LVSDPRELSSQVGHPAQGRYDQRTGVFLDGERIVLQSRQIVRPHFRLPGSLSRHGSRIEGVDAIYQPAVGTRPAGYLLRGLTAPADLAGQQSISGDGTAVLLCPGDTPWLGADQCYVASEVEPELLRAGRHWQQHASTGQLIRGLANPSLDLGADVRVAIHTRLLQPFLDATLLMVGLPLVLSRDNRNMFAAVGLAIVVVALFMLVLIVCQFLGSANFVSPAFAAWLPLVVFVPLAVATSRPLTE